jgi:cyclopropane fatty-acyl-phospholipid synthase-like methyltransferase
MRARRTARSADPHELYEESVQDPEADVAVLSRQFLKERGRKARTLREDFCGTALLCATWIRSARDRTAIGVDLDAATMAWGRRRHFDAIESRMSWRRADVRRVKAPRVDLVTAFNFSWCVFTDRPTLLRYFRGVRAGLVRDGLFALDLHGGPDSLAEMKDSHRMGGFTYVWDQGPLDALSHRTVRRIHFEFNDGTRLRDVYRYDWRIWMLPETRDALQEAGFARVDVLWEGYDAKGDGNGRFRRVERAENEDSWVAYLLAWK